MKIAVASGKGGTGKTTVAVSLALSLAAQEPVQLLDCDVEEPNAHLFLKPKFADSRSVDKLLPEIDPNACTLCGECVQVCEFNALALVGERVLRFDALCHGCGRCGLVCPAGAIGECSHQLGRVQSGTATGIQFAQGVLNVGETMATPIVHALTAEVDAARTNILDAPPGTGCPAIATLHASDLALLVTEPTPFGLHDLRAAVQLSRTLDLPIAVIINRADIGDARVATYCEAERIPILLTIPFDRSIAATYAVGTPLVHADPSWRERFLALASQLKEMAR